MTPRKTLPSQERLRELFDYHEDGYFVRRTNVGHRRGDRAGDVVRGSRTREYLTVGVDGGDFLLHRLIFQWHHGWCPDTVDHYPDRAKDNCRIGNLRQATPAMSKINTGPEWTSETGIKNVYPHRGGRFKAQLKRGGVWHFLGCFDSTEEAEAAVSEFRRKEDV